MKPISLKAINSRLHHHLKEALDGKRCLWLLIQHGGPQTVRDS
jgi:hypothetical protein